MPNYWPLSSGNWSNLSNWLTANTAPFNAAVLPTATDDVYANNKIIYVDTNAQVASVRNVARTGILQGGGFIINNGISLSANVEGGDASACVRFVSAAPATGSLYGHLSCNNPSILAPIAFSHSGTGYFFISGNALGFTNSNPPFTFTNSGYINNISSGTLDIVGTINGPLTGSGQESYAVGNTSTGTINITGNIFGGRSISYPTYNVGLVNSSSGTVNISSNFITALWGPAIENVGSGTLNVISNIISGGPIGGLGVHGIANGRTRSGVQQSFVRGSVNVIGNLYGGVGSNALNSVLGSGFITVSGDVFGGLAGAISSNTNILINGNIYGGRSSGFGGFADIVTVNGNVFGGIAASSTGISVSFPINLTVNGFVSGGNVSSSRGIVITTANVTVNGNVFGGDGASASGIEMSGQGTLVVNGTATGGNGSSAHGVSNTSTGSVFLRRAVANDWGRNSTGPINGSAVGLSNSSIYGICAVEELRSGGRGLLPTTGNVYINTKATSNASFFSLLSSVFYSPLSSISANPNYSSALSGVTGFNFLYSALSGDSTLVPTVSNVRRGVVYNFSNSTGTIFIPNPFTVRSGTPTDNTVGLGVFDPSLVWIAPLTGFQNITNSIGQRVLNATSIENMGERITYLL